MRLCLSIAIAAALTSATAACANRASASKSSLPAFSSPARSGNPLSTEDAGRRYLEIINPHNADINALGSAVRAGSSWTDVRALVLKMYQDNDIEAQALAATPWPPAVSPLVDKLVQDDIDQRQKWFDAANATNERDFNALLKRAYYSPAGGQNEASQIRAILGLDGTGNAPPLTSATTG